eukprot:3854525-Prymnesium_polylepis.1
MPDPSDFRNMAPLARLQFSPMHDATRRYRSKSEKRGRPPRASQAGLAVSRTPGRTPPPPASCHRVGASNTPASCNARHPKVQPIAPIG